MLKVLGPSVPAHWDNDGLLRTITKDGANNRQFYKIILNASAVSSIHFRGRFFFVVHFPL